MLRGLSEADYAEHRAAKRRGTPESEAAHRRGQRRETGIGEAAIVPGKRDEGLALTVPACPSSVHHLHLDDDARGADHAIGPDRRVGRPAEALRSACRRDGPAAGERFVDQGQPATSPAPTASTTARRRNARLDDVAEQHAEGDGRCVTSRT